MSLLQLHLRAHLCCNTPDILSCSISKTPPTKSFFSYPACALRESAEEVGDCAGLIDWSKGESRHFRSLSASFLFVVRVFFFFHYCRFSRGPRVNQPPSKVKVMGVCDPIPTANRVSVHPVVTYGGTLNLRRHTLAHGSSADTLEYNNSTDFLVNQVFGEALNSTKEEGEVSQVFLTSLANLARTRGSRPVRFKHVELPFFSPTFEAEACPVQIWGLTAIILDGLLKIISSRNMP